MMMHKTILLLHTLFLVGVAFGLEGCTFYARAPQEISQAQMEDTGLVVVSCTEDSEGSNERAQGVSFDYSGDQDVRKMDRMAFGILHTVPLFNTGVGDFGGRPVGTVYALSLKPGDYMFAGVMGTNTSGLVRPPRCFHVSPGTVTYIGNIHYRPFGDGRYTIEVKDMRDRDLPVFVKRYPAVKAEQVKFAIMEGQQIGFTIIEGQQAGLMFAVNNGVDHGFSVGSYQTRFERSRASTDSAVPH
jgi:hypothetical protein